ADGVGVVGHAADVYDPQTVRASQGSLFAVPVVRVGSSEELEPSLDGLRVVGTSARGDQELGTADLRGPIALVPGNETKELSRTALVEPVAELVQHRQHPDRRTYVGKGKLEELKEAYSAAGAEVLVVDDELDPVQQRTLENALQARVVDRTQLILDIFAQHAVTAEGKLQVELAQLEYNLPRMRGMWQHLERLGG